MAEDTVARNDPAQELTDLAGDLADIQQRFAECLLSRESPVPETLSRWLGSADAETVRAGMRVYRNNVWHSLRQALAAQYPAVASLVGQEFFNAIASDYIERHPPREPALNFYGESMAAFITAHPACTQLPWLADVARLEWHCQCVLHGVDDPALDSARLGALAAEHAETLALQVQRGAVLMSSRWPVHRIREQALSDDPQGVDTDAGDTTRLLLYRRDWQLRIVELQPAAYALLERLRAGDPLGAACQYAQDEFAVAIDEIPGLLSWLLDLQVFSRVVVRPAP